MRFFPCLNIGVASRDSGKYTPMTRIARTARIHEPHGNVIARLQDFFSQAAQTSGEGFGSLNGRGRGSILSTLRLDEGWLHHVAAWRSRGDRVGAVSIVWRDPYGSGLRDETDLVLEGSYEPPGGVVGQLFDRISGKSWQPEPWTHYSIS